jgi:hypothetical protein
LTLIRRLLHPITAFVALTSRASRPRPHNPKDYIQQLFLGLTTSLPAT